VGSPPGYVGHEEGGQLTEAVRRRPFSVVLLDEIEKAHYDVFNVLLQILEDGRLTDSQGHQVDFRNTIIIMTSNLGTAEIHKAAPLGFQQMAEGGTMPYADMKEKVVSELKRTFRPELLNRIDDVIVFNELSIDDVKAIADLMLDRVRVQLAEQDIRLEVTDAVKDVLVKEGFDPSMGARPLRRAIMRLIENPVSEAILRGTFAGGHVVLVDEKDGRLDFEVREDKSAAPVGAGN